MGKNLFILILAGLIFGCSITAGNKFDTSAVNRIEIGKTTEAEVISMLGMPWTKDRLGNGIDRYEYTYGLRLPLGMGTSVDNLLILCFNGVVIHKWQNLEQY